MYNMKLPDKCFKSLFSVNVYHELNHIKFISPINGSDDPIKFTIFEKYKYHENIIKLLIELNIPFYIDFDDYSAPVYIFKNGVFSDIESIGTKERKRLFKNIDPDLIKQFNLMVKL